MDYRGQALSETLQQIINVLFGVIGFVYGYYIQSFWVTFLWCVTGFLVASLVCIPDWPWFNRHPLPWQPVSVETDDENELCGTCVCGTSVHGINCDSHPRHGDGPSVAAVPEPASASPVTVAPPEVKSRGGNKKK